MSNSTNKAESSPYSAPQATEQGGEYPRSRIALFVLPAIVGLIADLWSKWFFFSQSDLRAGVIWWVLPDYAGVQLSLNEGALFGLGQGYVWLFAIFGIVAAAGLPVWLFRYGAACDFWITLALGFVMAGILGNLYDRVALHGETWFFDPARQSETAYAVRDWILLQWGPNYRWPNFNIADSLLVVGAGIVLLRAMFDQSMQQSDTKTSVATEKKN
ncbi:signal peptidase II [Aeoliella mucimassa]|uniref:Lipoprotein signal peptidase n=1 Tax=Aeoliella mucimassa TaxID=2527972 RepID=A0A518ANQ0_9BACT|nr:signal peptidase II [Aeoliella mucimassa]QDU56347.1 lipoprotein signal peptidase [Aeoliella mucimassa]